MNLSIRRAPDVGNGAKEDFRRIAQTFWTQKQRPAPDAAPALLPQEPGDDPLVAPAGGSPRLLGFVGGSFVGTYTNKEIEQREAIARAAAEPAGDGYVDFSKYDAIFKKSGG